MVDTVTTATYRVKVEGKEAVDALDASLDALAVTEDRVEVSQEKVTRATRTTEAGFNRLRASLDPAVRAHQRYEAAVEKVARYEADGIGTAQERARVIELATRKYTDQIAALEKAAQAQSRYNLAATDAAQASKAAAQAMVNSQLIVPNRGADIAAYGKSLDDLRAKYNPLYAAGQQYKATLADINRAAQVGAITENERAAAVMDTKVAFTQQVNSLRGVTEQQEFFARGATRAGAASKEMAAGTGLARHELINLGRQAQDIVVSLQGGQGLFTVMLQQGTQVIDIFAASRATVGDFFKQATSWAGSFLTAGRLAFGGIALTIGGAAVALNSYLDAQQKVQMSLVGAGRASGASISSINSAASLGSSTFGLSVSEARNLATALAATGKVANDNILPIVKMGHDVAVAFGVDAKEATSLLAGAFADPVKGAEELNQRLGFLDASMQRQIINLTASGRLWEAQKVLMSGVQSGLVGVNEAVATSTNFWTALGNKASNAWDAIGAGLSRATGLGLKLGLDEQIKVAQERLDSFQKDVETAKRWMREGGVSAADAGYDAAIAGVQKWKAALDAATNSLKANASAAEEAQARQRSFAQDAAMRAALPEVSELETLRQQAEQLRRGIEDTQRAISNLIPDEAMGSRLKQLTDILDQFQKALGRTDTAITSFKTSYDRAIQQQEFQLRGLTVFSPGAKGQVARDEAYARGLDQFKDPDKAATYAENARLLAIRQVAVAIGEQNRAQVLASKQAVDSAQLEIDMIGLSIGKQAELRANLQAQQQLYQQAAQNRTLVNGQLNASDQATLDLIKAQNAELAKRNQLRAVGQLASDIKFERSQIGLSDSEASANARLRQIYGDDVTGAQAQFYKQQLMINDALRQYSDIGRDATKGLISDLLAGKNALESVSNMLTKIGNKLIDMAADGLWSKALGGAGGGSGLLSLLGLGSGGGGGIASTISVGSQTFPAFSAKGNVFANDNVSRFAQGGAFTNQIVTNPTLFQYAQGGRFGLGEMGEAGPEAVVPLHRMPNGNLGVQMSGGGGNVVHVAFAPVYNVQGSGPEIQQLRQQMLEDRVNFEARVKKTVREAQYGGALR